eukprot:2481613-Pyramimonas_sp.AAC.1
MTTRTSRFMRAALFSSILASSYSSGTTLPQVAAAAAAVASTEPMIGQKVSTYVLAEPFDQWSQFLLSPAGTGVSFGAVFYGFGLCTSVHCHSDIQAGVGVDNGR